MDNKALELDEIIKSAKTAKSFDLGTIIGMNVRVEVTG